MRFQHQIHKKKKKKHEFDRLDNVFISLSSVSVSSRSDTKIPAAFKSYSQ